MYFLSAKLQSVIFVIASKTWTLNAAAAARKKIRRRLYRSVDDFDSTEIRLGTSAKFDGAGV